VEEISRLRKIFNQRDSSGRLTTSGARRAVKIIEKAGGYVVKSTIHLPPEDITSQEVQDAVDYLVHDWDMELKEYGKEETRT